MKMCKMSHVLSQLVAWFQSSDALGTWRHCANLVNAAAVFLFPHKLNFDSDLCCQQTVNTKFDKMCHVLLHLAPQLRSSEALGTSQVLSQQT